MLGNVSIIITSFFGINRSCSTAKSRVGIGSNMSQNSDKAFSLYFEELKVSAGERYGIRPEDCHLGHILLHSMLKRPDLVHQIVDPSTGFEINEPNKTGELWLRGPYVFKGYYKMPEETIKTFSKDGWFKTGDLFRKDENENYYFVDRLKLLIKYKNYQISPTELEALIASLPGVAEVGVTGVPSEEDGELVVAIVVRDAAHNPPVTADDIRSIVKERLQDSKQIRGGVFFIDALPLNINGKIDRAKLKEIAENKVNE